MRAVLCRQWGTPDTLTLEDIPSPQTGADEVLIDVKACALSFPDVLTIQGKYQIKPAFPFSPGVEVAGIIKAVGSGIGGNAGFKPGDRVFGRVANGCADEVVTKPDFLWQLPPVVGFEVGAGFAMNYGTSYYALKVRGQLKAGETLLVLGASGGVGLAAVELGKMLGARVIACASTTEKLEVCKRAGADDTINYETENLREAIKRLTQDRGVDVVYDPVGDKFADPAVRGLAWGGRSLVVGFAAGEIPKVALNLPLLKGGAIVGVWWGGLIKNDPAQARRLTQELVNLIADGRLKPLISATYPLAQTGDALADLMARKVTGKIVVVTGDA